LLFGDAYKSSPEKKRQLQNVSGVAHVMAFIVQLYKRGNKKGDYSEFNYLLTQSGTAEKPAVPRELLFN
jgi:hypothetical protein